MTLIASSLNTIIMKFTVARNNIAKPRLTRPKNPMPAFVPQALNEQGLMEAYRARPPYQQNDYLGWIAQAKRDETKQKRLAKMLSELKGGKLYMNMAWRPRNKSIRK